MTGYITNEIHVRRAYIWVGRRAGTEVFLFSIFNDAPEMNCCAGNIAQLLCLVARRTTGCSLIGHSSLYVLLFFAFNVNLMVSLIVIRILNGDIITSFKPKPKLKPKPKVNPALIAPPPFPKSKPKPKLTKAGLARQIDFDLGLTRLSVLMDVLSHMFVVLSASPNGVHVFNVGGRKHSMVEMFIAASSLGSFGAGAYPAVQSLAISILQLRALRSSRNSSTTSSTSEPEDPVSMCSIGALFGALAVLQTLGQSILGPLLFGLVYSSTVGTYPKAIFLCAACVGVGALALLFLVRPVGVGAKVKAGVKMGRTILVTVEGVEREVERGRSRVSKDLRGGAASAKIGGVGWMGVDV